MYYGNIKPFSIENGPGVRVSLFVSGCTHKCEGCFSADTWDFRYGEPYTEETEEAVIGMLRPAYIQGLTLLGGDPGEPVNQRALLPLLRRIRRELPGKDVWVYSGYLYEEFRSGGPAACEVTEEFLSLCDVMVDGPFVREQKNQMLSFRGSENQRIIALRETERLGRVTELSCDRQQV
ncbi:anaerobic ribonucleoside-triphosphate reductase activating protein [Lachnospiraceae bacterium JLR.KK008]